MSDKAKSGDMVKVHYKGSLEDGEVFDTSAGREPLEFTVGSGQVIPGFDEAVIGMGIGESKTKHIPSEEAYGPRRNDLQMQVERAKLPDTLDLKVGAMLGIQSHTGDVTRVTVTDLTDDTVTLDANHPLAGKDLTFEIELVEILAA
jgi:peptidylprolyl isomerase